MPVRYLRGLTGVERTQRSNRHLARILAAVAGTVNAGGFLAVRQYTSHMTGVVSRMAGMVAEGEAAMALQGAGAVAAFLGGAFLTTLMIRYARARALKSAYAAPLLVEAALLIGVGLLGRAHGPGLPAPWTVLMLCSAMGLQNAMVTKISGAVIRTTHLTGMITDIGISLGRLCYGPMEGDGERGAEMARLRLHASLIGLFFTGGVAGALLFRQIGSLFALPCAVVLLLMAALPVAHDVRELAG